MVKSRRNDYLKFHTDKDDCQIVAEAEIGGLDILLTYDDILLKKLRAKTKSITLMKATEFWDRLKIPKGVQPQIGPATSNPLYNKDWWRW